MTNPNEIARGIVTKFNGEGACLSNTDETYLEELIAAALREMYQQGRDDGSDAKFEAATPGENV